MESSLKCFSLETESADLNEIDCHAGILGSLPNPLRADRGIDTQWFHSGGNNLERTMWGSSGKEGFSTAGRS